MKDKLIWWVNGKFIDSFQAKIPITDLSVTRGFGCFDFLRTYGGKPFLLKDHLVRLENSANYLHICLPYSLKKIEKLTSDLLEKNKAKEVGIKIIVTGGEAKNGIIPDNKPILAILVSPIEVYPKSYYEKGVGVITTKSVRIIPQAKTLNYLGAVLAMREAKQKGAVEALYVDDKKNVLEMTRSNVFVFINNALLTPKDGVLKGITRKVVLKIAKKYFKMIEASISLEKLYKADEVFMTASNKEVMPVVKIDRRLIGNGKVGERTRKIMELFRKFTEKFAAEN